MTASLATRRSEQGFTLVELAIVMIIIGLLIGGILKGQELIANARVASTVSQVKAIDAATTTFRDKYAAMPGDMSTATTRLPDKCVDGTSDCADGSGDNRLDDLPLTDPAGSEGEFFFQHLAAADLLGGIAFDGGGGWGDLYPAASVDGGFVAGYNAGAGVGAAGVNAPVGHYLSLVIDPGIGTPDITLTPNQAQRIDTKLDDGAPATGNVIASVAACANGSLYDEATQDKICDLAIRFQN